MKVSKTLVVVTVTALAVGMATAAPATALSGESDVQRTILSKTGKDAIPVTADQSLNGVSVSVGRDASTNTPLDSYAQTDTNSVRMMAVVGDASQGAVDYNLTLPDGAQVIDQGDGSLVVGRPVPGQAEGPYVFEQLGTINAPWATDASGKDLPTTYSFSGGVLTQKVNTDGAVFPVVADPLFSFGWGIYINVLGVAIRGIVSAVYVAGAGGIAITCAGYTKLASPLAGIVKALCFVIGSTSMIGVIQNVVSLWHVQAIQNGYCYQKRIVPNIGYFVRLPAVTSCF